MASDGEGMIREDTVYDYEHGRWLCSTRGDASECVEKNPGESVYVYDRDHDGRMINIKPYWTPAMKDKNRLTTIRNGRLQ